LEEKVKTLKEEIIQFGNLAQDILNCMNPSTTYALFLPEKCTLFKLQALQVEGKILVAGGKTLLD
jgi:hypothetical protein